MIWFKINGGKNCWQVVLASGKDVADIKPQFEEVKSYSGRGVIITGPAPEGSGFDFFSRFFCPKLGVNEVSISLLRT